MILRDDTRKTIKFIIWVVILAIIFYIASIFVFYKAGSSSRNNDQQIVRIANQKTPITNVQNYYHLNQGTNSYAIKGTDKKGKVYYFIYLPSSKKAYLYQSDKAVSQNKISKIFYEKHPNSNVKSINLGWYQSQPVWEVAYQNKNSKLGFTLYDFHNAKLVNEVDNL